MPDTRRTESALLTLFADNASGDISAQDGRDVITSVHPAKIVQSDTQANEPSSGQLAGDLFLPNNGFQIERYSGSAWQPWGPLFPFTKPVDGDFSWLNQGTASVVTTNGGVHLLGVADGSEAIRARVKAVPSAPYTITAAFLPRFYAANSEGSFPNCGLLWSDGTNAGSSKIIIIGFYQESAGALRDQLYIRKYDNATTFNAGVLSSAEITLRSPCFWMKLEDESTNRKGYISADGQNWLEIYSETRTTFLTATHVGFYCNSHAATKAPAMTLLSWKEA